MVASLTYSGPTKSRNGVIITVAGDAITTARIIEVTHPSGAIQAIPVTTSGAGGAVVNVVPGEPGTISTRLLSAPAVPTVIVAAVTETIVT